MTNPAKASILVAEAERCIAKANPALKHGGNRRGADFNVPREDVEIPPSTLRNIRQAHAALDDGAFERCIAKANPALKHGPGRGIKPVPREDGFIPPSTLRNIRQAHAALDDGAEFVQRLGHPIYRSEINDLRTRNPPPVPTCPNLSISLQNVQNITHIYTHTARVCLHKTYTLKKVWTVWTGVDTRREVVN